MLHFGNRVRRIFFVHGIGAEVATDKLRGVGEVPGMGVLDLDFQVQVHFQTLTWSAFLIQTWIIKN